MIKRKVWLLPRTQDIIKKRNGYKYHKRVAELAKTAKPTKICSLKPNHKNHLISKCKAINNYKARMSNKKSNSFAVINLPGDKPDDDLTTSKETNSSNKNA
ncbi:unnamed protein product [Cylindrotheca closterium]|uniref:Uncharacterized protein n=1 Tax=Cylindrotheca closterium TaxID=2856 RepID=A0AAD2PUV6_9STRA|nr:unnamed protein product [Cylindrotheca closterium]